MRVKNDYPSDWNTRRKRVYKRDGYTCQNCGRKGGPRGDHELHAHHNVPKSKGGTHKLSNLTTLCKNCHDAIHHKSKIAPIGRQRTKKSKGSSAGRSTTEKSDSKGVGRFLIGVFCILAVILAIAKAMFGEGLAAILGIAGIGGTLGTILGGFRARVKHDTLPRMDKVAISASVLIHLGAFCFSFVEFYAGLSILDRLWFSFVSTFITVGVTGIAFLLVLPVLLLIKRA